MGDTKSGFVYIWRDRKHNRYYIGCHWGLEDDGYVCSSRWMKQSFGNRPKDFQRRILIRNIETRKEMFAEETRILQMIKPEEIKVRYYNLCRGQNTGHWSAGPDARTIAQKSGNARRGKPLPAPVDRGAKISASKQAAKLKRLQETGCGTSEAQQASGKKTGSARLGAKLTNEHKRKIGQNHKSKNPDFVHFTKVPGWVPKSKKVGTCHCGQPTTSTRAQFCPAHRYEAMNKSRASREGSKWHQ